MKEECQVFTRGEYVPNAWGDVPTVLDMPMAQSGLQQCFRIVLNGAFMLCQNHGHVMDCLICNVGGTNSSANA